MNILNFPVSHEEAMHQHLLYYSKVTGLLAMVLIAGGIGLDLSFYPEYAFEFGLSRLVVVCFIGITLWLFRYPSLQIRIRSFIFIWMACAQLMIAWMIYYSDGATSIYFVGLPLAVSGLGVFMPLTTREALSFVIFTLLVYVIACIAHPNGVVDIVSMIGRLIFMVFYSAIAVTVGYYGDRLRRITFDLQATVGKQKDELIAQNKLLVDIKGQMIQQEKMAAIGTLSAGLLHELNNPVNVSLMAIKAAKMNPGDDELRDCLDDATEAMMRIMDIVTDLETFAYQKQGDQTGVPFPLERAVRSAARLAGADLKGVQVEFEVPANTQAVGQEPAIIGVLINLLSNAGHAVLGAQRTAPKVTVRVEPDGDRLTVSVRDNGVGIAANVMPRVFEPFFTTREVGSGLGLGLSMCYSIVQRHGGTLKVRSEPGEWTEFSFDIPSL